jgi:hypothetical protein
VLSFTPSLAAVHCLIHLLSGLSFLCKQLAIFEMSYLLESLESDSACHLNRSAMFVSHFGALLVQV